MPFDTDEYDAQVQQVVDDIVAEMGIEPDDDVDDAIGRALYKMNML